MKEGSCILNNNSACTTSPEQEATDAERVAGPYVPKPGIASHCFKANTTNSKRSRDVSNMIHTLGNAPPTSKRARRKNAKLDEFKKKWVSKEDNEVSKSLVRQSMKSLSSRKTKGQKGASFRSMIIFSGDQTRTVKDSMPGRDRTEVKVLSAITDCTVVDDGPYHLGLQLIDVDDVLIATKVPRQSAITPSRHPKPQSIVECMKDFVRKYGGKERGMGKLVMGGNYAYHGYTALKNQPTISKPKFSKRIEQSFKRIQNLFLDFMPSPFLRGINEAKQFVPHMKEIHTGLYAAMAVGENVYLSQHMDEDMLWSTTSVHCNDKICLDGQGNYEFDAPVACYFVFGEVGKAVALRPGDVLIFNTQKVHSVSRRTDPYDDKEIICVSYYTKTAVAAGNSNHKEPSII